MRGDATGDRTGDAGAGEGDGDGEDAVAAAESALEALRRADREFREAAEGLPAPAEARRVEDAHDEVTRLLEAYEDRATGSGREEFQSFVEFKARLAATVENLDADLPRRSAFEEVREAVDGRRLDPGDFERARGALSPASALVEAHGEREAARARYRTARNRALDAVEALDGRIDRLQRVRDLGRADLSAPVEELRAPVEAYDEAVTDAFRRFREERPARDLLEWVADTRQFPLVPYRPPPEELLAYLRSNAAGEEPVPTLLEYAEYSRSKLGHYVDRPRELKRRIATRRTYLEGLDADPLRVGWPPPPADRLRFRGRELVSAVARFADDDVVARARRLQRLPGDPEVDYDRLREAAVAEARLDDRDRRRVESGAVEDDLDRARDLGERLRSTLEDLPER